MSSKSILFPIQIITKHYHTLLVNSNNWVHFNNRVHITSSDLTNFIASSINSVARCRKLGVLSHETSRWHSSNSDPWWGRPVIRDFISDCLILSSSGHSVSMCQPSCSPVLHIHIGDVNLELLKWWRNEFRRLLG